MISIKIKKTIKIYRAIKADWSGWSLSFLCTTLFFLYFINCGRINFAPESLLKDKQDTENEKGKPRRRLMAMSFTPPDILVGESSQIKLNFFSPADQVWTSSFVIDPSERISDSNKGEIKAGESFDTATFIAPFRLSPLEKARSTIIEVIMTDGKETLKFRKRVNIWAKDAIKKEDMNVNPTHQGIVIEGNVTSIEALDKKLTDEISKNDGVKIEAKVVDTPGDSDHFQFRWYSTHGRFKTFSAYKTQWFCYQEEVKDGSINATIYSIVRDSKGGMAWSKKQITCHK